ncbi:MAG: hypothetical protein QOI80_1253 [Solirubrobacteraceae bacterium]|nr:hypothetical protein [Solirubrobacteraceae bacterium]
MAFEAGGSVARLLGCRATERPDHRFLWVEERGPWTLGALAGAAAGLATTLREAGAQPGDRVLLRLGNDARFLPALAAAWSAGAVPVVMHPAAPLAEVERVIAGFGVRAAVSARADSGSLADADSGAATRATLGVPAIVVPDPEVGSAGGELAIAEVEPEDDALVLLTSGSTGEPKGVLVEHAGLANLVDWHIESFGLGAEDRCTQIASPGFDASVWEIWPCLATGASIHVVPEELRGDPMGLRDWLIGERITVSFLPTAVAEGLIGLAWPADCALRYLLTGGDALTSRPAAGLPFTVVNNYGLSETAVVATSGPVAPEGSGAPTIGRPIRGIAAEVVDADLEPVPPGHDGELVVGGVAVGPGYLNRPDLTAERFLVDERGRRYRTGDRVRRREHGEIEFLGRLDDQLSIRGFRVEPGEVAAALNGHPGIEASVAVGSGASAARRLVAYVVAAGAEPPDEAELDAFLGGVLPEHMIPSGYVWLDALPVTANGKIDRAALPDPAAPAIEAPLADGAVGDIETRIVGIMAELLEVAEEEIGRDQNFFLLGGHSMLGAQLIVRLERYFGAELSLRYLFDHPTPRLIAGEVERQMAEELAAG